MAKKQDVNELYNPGGTLYNIDSVLEIIDPINSNSTTTITAKNGFTITSKIEGGGFSNEQTSYIFTGTVPINKPTPIATIEIEAKTGKYITRSPYLIYKNNIKTTRASGLRAELRCDGSSINIESCAINHVGYGSHVINQSGTSRPIKIYGTPGSAFELAINENLLDAEKNEGVATGRLLFQKPNDTSILSAGNANSTTTYDYAKSMSTISGTLGSNGLYSFIQKFPSNTFQRITTAPVSSSTNLDINDVTDLKIGDRIYHSSITLKAPIFIDSISAATNRIITTSAVTIEDKDLVWFKRRRSYSIDLIPQANCIFGSKIPTSNPNYTLNQYLDPTLIIKLSTVGTALTITHISDLGGVAAATGLSAGVEHYTYYEGRAGRYPAKVNPEEFILRREFGLTYTIHAHGGGTAFTESRHPVFSEYKPYDGTGTPSKAQLDGGSDWTNTLPLSNGGTHVQMFCRGDLSTQSTTNDTYTLEIFGKIYKWGFEDVTMELDLDKILTVA